MKKLPCPRCGKLKRLSVKQMSRMLNPREWEAGWEVQCDNCCMSSGIAQTKEKAVEVWNALPRHLRWTRETPTENGWYIYQERRNRRLCCVIDGKVTGFAFGLYNVEDLSGEWAGPIPDPQEPQR